MVFKNSFLFGLFSLVYLVYLVKNLAYLVKNSLVYLNFFEVLTKFLPAYNFSTIRLADPKCYMTINIHMPNLPKQKCKFFLVPPYSFRTLNIE